MRLMMIMLACILLNATTAFTEELSSAASEWKCFTTAEQKVECGPVNDKTLKKSNEGKSDYRIGLEIQMTISELGGEVGALDGKIGQKTLSAASAILGQDASSLDAMTLLESLQKALAKKDKSEFLPWTCLSDENGKAICEPNDAATRPSNGPTCASNPLKCEANVLCQYSITFTGNFYRWSTEPAWSKYVNEAKQRGLACPEIENEKRREALASWKCDTNLASCSAVDLCELATLDTSKSWQTGENEKYVVEAAQRKLSCGVEVEAKEAELTVDELREQLAAANTALAEQKESGDAAIAKIKDEVTHSYVEKRLYDESQSKVSALNAALAELRADIASGTVSIKSYETQEQQLLAANAALADQNEKIKEEFVPKREYEQKVSEIEALNKSLVELRNSSEAEYAKLKIDSESRYASLLQTIKISYVEKLVYDRDVSELSQQVSALNSSLIEQRNAAEEELARQVGALNSSLMEQQQSSKAELDSQVGALNATMVDMQTRIEAQKRRLAEVNAALSSFVSECKEIPECSAAMNLE